MSVDLLRQAAAKMRQRADQATGEFWLCRWAEDATQDEVWSTDEVSFIAAVGTGEDANHIASWHPAVAQLVAKWLEEAAWIAESAFRGSVDAGALAVARAYLGRDS